MKYIKLFEAFNSKLISKLSKFTKLKMYIVDTLKEEDIIISKITDIYEDDKLIEFTSAIDGYNKILNKNYLKFFINDVSDIDFILFGDNTYKDRMNAGYNKIDEDYVVFNTDFCLILDMDKIKEKFSGHQDLLSKREEIKSGAFDKDSDVRRRNVERYEEIIFSKYGFFDEERNITEGLRLFFEKVLSKISPIELILNSDFYSLFTYIREYQLLEDDSKEKCKRDIIHYSKRLLSCDPLDLSKLDEMPDKLKDLNEYSPDKINYMFNELIPIIQSFNKNFNFNKILSDKIDLIVLSQQILSMRNMFTFDEGNLLNFIRTLDSINDGLVHFYNSFVRDERLNTMLDNLKYYSPKKEVLKRLDYSLKTFLRIVK